MAPIRSPRLGMISNDLLRAESRQHQCSIAWGVVADGSLVLDGGVAAAPDATPTRHTMFRIASMTKSFTAAADPDAA